MRIFERLPGRAHAARAQRKRYDGVIAALSRTYILDHAERGQDETEEHPALSVEPDRSER